MLPAGAELADVHAAHPADLGRGAPAHLTRHHQLRAWVAQHAMGGQLVQERRRLLGCLGAICCSLGVTGCSTKVPVCCAVSAVRRVPAASAPSPKSERCLKNGESQVIARGGRSGGQYMGGPRLIKSCFEEQRFCAVWGLYILFTQIEIVA